jgi:transcriptional regulator with XRE-family HTH domain
MKAWRIGQDLSQAEVAKLLEISQAAYSNLESGRVDTALSTVAKAMEITRLDAVALLAGQDPLEAARDAMLRKGLRMILEPLPAPPAPGSPQGERT